MISTVMLCSDLTRRSRCGSRRRARRYSLVFGRPDHTERNQISSEEIEMARELRCGLRGRCDG